jgi:hypothetical protein
MSKNDRGGRDEQRAGGEAGAGGSRERDGTALTQ